MMEFDFLAIVTWIFLLLEILNVFLLYRFPESTRGNALGFFTAYQKAKADPEIYALVRYLTNWVAGTKLIFIALLAVILIIGDHKTLFFCVIALVLSIMSFYTQLYPIIRKMDEAGNINPKGYSKTLWIMITVFIGFFIVALIHEMLTTTIL